MANKGVLRTDEWVAEIAKIIKKRKKGVEGGFTSKDASDMWGITVQSASRRISQLIHRGRAKYLGRRHFKNIIGVDSHTNVYELMPEDLKSLNVEV